jgi:hypothetical protein
VSNLAEGKHQGNRVFHVDRECYVVYMGTEGHDVRPFLRIGTTAFLPEQIKRHIGSVVITDRLTGNFLLEADCLDPRIIGHIRYVGSPELLDAVKHHAHGEQIGSIALEPVAERVPDKGGQVIFYDDGNLRVFLDGHRLFDLTQRERADRHSIFRLERIDSIVTSSRGSFREEDFQKPGFVTDGNGSLAHFANGRLHVIRQAPGHTVTEWGLPGIPLSLIQGVGSDVPPDDYVELYRFRSARGLPVFQPDPELPGFDVFGAAGLEVTQVSPPHPPGNAPVTDGSAWILPEGEKWHGNTPPPLLPGVAYRYDDSPPELEFRHLMTKELQKRVDTAEEPDAVLNTIAGDSHVSSLDRVCASFWLWNRRFTGDAGDLVLTAFRTTWLPVIGLVRKDGDQWRVRFMPRPGLSRSAVGDNEKARDKIAPYLNGDTDGSVYRKERERLLAFLQQLVAAGHARDPAPTTAADAAAAAATPPEKKGTTRQSSATDSPGATAGSDRTGRTDTAPTSRPGGSSTTSGPSRRSGSSTGTASRSRSYLAVAIVLLLLLGIGGAFLATRLVPEGGASPAVADTSVADTSVADTPGVDAPPADGPVADGPVADGSGETPAESTPDSDTETGDLPEPAQPSESAGATPERSAPEDSAPSSDREVQQDDPSAQGASAETPAEIVGPDGSSPWTVQDVLRVTNWIAGANGFRPIGANDVENRRDPDWIFPGNVFRLPDGELRTVVTGNTLWSIAADFLNEIFLASNMELSHFRDLIDSEEYPVDELKRRRGD